MLSRCVGLALAVAVLAFGGVGRAGEAGGEADGESVTCEHAKLATQDATPTDPGAWEFDIGYELERVHHRFDNSWGPAGRPVLREREVDVAVQYGLVPDVSIGIAAGYANVLDGGAAPAHAGGMTDVELSAKWRCYDDPESGLSIAYVPALALPTGNHTVSDRFAILYNGVALSKDWTDRLTSDFDLGYAFAFGGRREGYRCTLSADAALGYHVTQWLQPEIELNYAHDFVRGGDSDVLAVTAGLIVCANAHVRLGVGVQHAVAGRNADRSTAVMGNLALVY
jgi:hypothetical protein